VGQRIVSFVPAQEGNPLVIAAIDEEGGHAIVRAPTGPVKIAAQTLSAAPPPSPPPAGSGASPAKVDLPEGVDPSQSSPGARANKGKSRYMKIPDKYADAEQGQVPLHDLHRHVGRANRSPRHPAAPRCLGSRAAGPARCSSRRPGSRPPGPRRGRITAK